MENIEKLVRQYLRNKQLYDEYVNGNIKFIQQEINRIQNSKYEMVIEEAVLPGYEAGVRSNTNAIKDPVFSTLMYWQQINDNFINEQAENIKRYTKALKYYASLKIVYEQITCILCKLHPFEKEVIDLYMKGYKYEAIALDLKCCKSKTTLLIKKSIKKIVGNIDPMLVEKVVENQH